MVTVAIIALVAGFTFGELNTSSYKLKTAARTLKGNMQKARLLSVKNSCPVYVDFDFDDNGVDKKYTIWKDLNWNNDTDPDTSGTCNDATTDNNGDGAVNNLDEELIDTITLPKGVSFGYVASGDGGPSSITKKVTYGSNQLRFNPRGTSSSGSAYIHSPNQDSAGTYQVRTNNIGRIKYLYYATNGSKWKQR